MKPHAGIAKRFYARTVVINPLADFPDVIQTLAKWFYDEWHGFDGRSIQSIANQLSENLNREAIPITFVVHHNSKLIGSVSLDLSDLPSFDHLSPWLASLYVHAPFRGRGVGRALIRHVQDFASSRGIAPLYLWTPGSTRLYEGCGWAEYASATYATRPIEIMRFQNGRTRSTG